MRIHLHILRRALHMHTNIRYSQPGNPVEHLRVNFSGGNVIDECHSVLLLSLIHISFTVMGDDTLYIKEWLADTDAVQDTLLYEAAPILSLIHIYGSYVGRVKA